MASDPLFIPAKADWKTAEVTLSQGTDKPCYWNGEAWVPLPNARGEGGQWTWDIPEGW